MISCWWRLLVLGSLLAVLAWPLHAQNTKGDRPAQTRENRFQKGSKTKKEKLPKDKRIRAKRTTSAPRNYRPRKDRKGGDQAARPVFRLRTKEPDNKPHNVFPASGPYVNNPSKRRRRIEGRSNTYSQHRSPSPRPSGPAKNVYPRTGPYVNNPSKRSRRVEGKSNTYSQYRNPSPRPSRPVKNVFPQSGKYINYSSTAGRKPPGERRIRPHTATRSFTARRSVNAWANYPRPRQRKERAYRGDITGRRIRKLNYETRRPSVVERPKTGTRLSATPKLQRRNIYPQSGPYVNSGARSGQRQPIVSNRSTLSRLERMQSGPPGNPRGKRRIRPRSASGPYMARRSTNVWAHYPRPRKKGERAVTKDISGRPLRMRNYESPRPVGMVNPTARPYQRSKRLGDQPYSARGRGYRSRTRTGLAWIGDITNRRIRKNFTSKRGVEGQPIVTPEKKRLGMRDQGEGFSGFLKARRAAKGGGSVSGGRWNNDGKAIQTRPPGMGAWGLTRYRGFLKREGGRAKDKAAGYAGNIRYRGKNYQDQGEEFTGTLKARKPGRPPGIGRRGIDRYAGNIRFGGKDYRDQGEEFTGSIKARRPGKGGGSVSFRLWNNNGRPIAGRAPGIGARRIDKYSGNIRFAQRDYRDQGEEFTGTIKTHRPQKGGGSVSFRLWNNNGRAVAGRTPGIGARGIDSFRGRLLHKEHDYRDQGEEFTGTIKAKRPLKGGGSVSFRLWNNDGRPIAGRSPGIGARGIERFRGRMLYKEHDFRDQGEEFTGTIKAHRPDKGGGSVSGKLWNNNERPVISRAPAKSAIDAGRFAGNMKVKRAGRNEQGVESLGRVRGKAAYVKSPNADDEALKVRKPGESTFAIARLTMKTRRNQVHNPNADNESIKVKKPSPDTREVANLQIKVKAVPHSKNRSAADGSLPAIKPSKSSMKANQYARVVKRSYDVSRNPNSANDALRVREPGQAYARAVDYQGNIKFRKFSLFESKADLHPDAKFVKMNKNNVDEERDLLTNFRLWWSRLFRKNDSQPSHLKDKNHKPRYDKGEAGLWYD